MTLPVNPQLGHIIKETLTVPAGGYVELPRPDHGSNQTSIGYLYQFAGDNTADVELVVTNTDTLGSTIASGVAYNYGGTGVPKDSPGYYRYLYSVAGSDITVVLTRVK